MSEFDDMEQAELEIAKILRTFEEKHGRSVWNVDVLQTEAPDSKVAGVQIRVQTYSYPMLAVKTDKE